VAGGVHGARPGGPRRAVGTRQVEATPEVAPEVDPEMIRIVAERGAHEGRVRPVVGRSGDLDARAAVGVEEVELGAFDRQYVRTVRGPDRREVAVALRRGEREGVAPVGTGDPEVLGAVAVAHEDDALALRGEARLHVVALAARDARRLAAVDRQRVEVAEELEDDRLAVGGEVERDPGPLVGGEFERAGRDEREPVGPARGRGRAVVLGGGLGRERGGCRGERPVEQAGEEACGCGRGRNQERCRHDEEEHGEETTGEVVEGHRSRWGGE